MQPHLFTGESDTQEAAEQAARTALDEFVMNNPDLIIRGTSILVVEVESGKWAALLTAVYSPRETKAAAPKPTEGWGWLSNSPKFHYFVNRESLCRRWMILDRQELTADEGSNARDCKACRRVLEKRQAKEQTTS